MKGVKDIKNHRGTTVHTVEQVGSTVVYYILGGLPGNTCQPGHVVRSIGPFDSVTTDKDEHDKNVAALPKREPPHEAAPPKIDPKQPAPDTNEDSDT